MTRRGRRLCAPAGTFLTFAVGVLCAQQRLAAGSVQTDAQRAGLGISKETAIEVCGPSGEHGYFDRLMCPDGSLVRYERIESAGFRHEPTTKADKEALREQMMTSEPIPRGERDFHMIGGYSVDCPAGKTILYVDRYHCPDAKNQGPPPGFSFGKDHAAESPQTEAAQSGLGLAKGTPVEVCGPKGARDYLDRLRCPDGSVVRFQRTGSMGFRSDPYTNADAATVREQIVTSGPIPSGQRDFHLIDGYSAECSARKTFLYFDPYHCPDPKDQSPPPGFSLAGS